jgi:hypothetical protein
VGAISGGISFGTAAALDASGEYMAYAFSAREDMTISHVSFRAGTAANAPTVEARIETLDPATGLPNGLWSTTTNGVSATITSNSNPVVALTLPAAVTKGQIFCVKLLWGGVATSTINIQNLSSIASPFNSSVPYGVTNTGTPTKGISTIALVAFGSSSTTFYNVPGAFPLSSQGAGLFNNTSSAKRGLKFTPPMNCRVVGVRFHASASVGDFNAILCTGDASGTELSSSSTAFEGDVNAASANAMTSVYFDNPILLTAGTAYRAVIEPTTSTNCNMGTFTIPTDQFGATPAGTTAVYTSCVSGTWTDSTTQLPMMDVLIDQVDNGSGTGGGGQRVISG